MTAAPGLRIALSDWMLLLLLSVIWGGSFVLAKVAVVWAPPLTLVWLRVSLAAVVLFAVMAVAGRQWPARRHWPAFVVMGLGNNLLPFFLIFWGQTQIGSGLASILNAATPLFTCILAHWLTGDERLTASRLLGVVVGIAGVVVMLGQSALSPVGEPLLAQLAVLGAALSYALTALYARRYLRGVKPISAAAGQLSASTLFGLPLMLLVDQPWLLPMPGVPIVLSILTLAVVCTALAYLLFFGLIGRVGAGNTSLVTLLIPVTALLLSGVFLGERLGLVQVAGMALILFGLLILDGRLRGVLWRPRPA